MDLELFEPKLEVALGAALLVAAFLVLLLLLLGIKVGLYFLFNLEVPVLGFLVLLILLLPVLGLPDRGVLL